MPSAWTPASLVMERNGSPVLGHVDDGAVGVSDEKSPQSPVFAGQEVDDLGSSPHRPLVNRVDVVDLDGDVGMDVGLDVQPGDAELHLGAVAAKEQDPVEAALLFQPDDALVEGPALVEAVGLDVGLDPPDPHSGSLVPGPLLVSAKVYGRLPIPGR